MTLAPKYLARRLGRRERPSAGLSHSKLRPRNVTRSSAGKVRSTTRPSGNTRALYEILGRRTASPTNAKTQGRYELLPRRPSINQKKNTKKVAGQHKNTCGEHDRRRGPGRGCLHPPRLRGTPRKGKKTGTRVEKLAHPEGSGRSKRTSAIAIQRKKTGCASPKSWGRRKF